MTSAGGTALSELGRELEDEGTPISPHVVATDAGSSFAAGRHAEVVEAVREGYLLHYETPRLMVGHDDDLALLAGDYLYALGIRRLAQSGDCELVLRLADLISASAEAHAEGRQADLPKLWEQTATSMADASQ